MKAVAADYFNIVNSEHVIDVLIGNFHQAMAKLNYQLTSGRLFITFGCFLLGMYSGRRQFFSKFDAHIEKFKLIKRNTGITLLVVAGAAVIFALIIGTLSIDIQKNLGQFGD